MTLTSGSCLRKGCLWRSARPTRPRTGPAMRVSTAAPALRGRNRDQRTSPHLGRAGHDLGVPRVRARRRPHHQDHWEACHDGTSLFAGNVSSIEPVRNAGVEPLARWSAVREYGRHATPPRHPQTTPGLRARPAGVHPLRRSLGSVYCVSACVRLMYPSWAQKSESIFRQRERRGFVTRPGPSWKTNGSQRCS
jgi:hypothetical protein